MELVLFWLLVLGFVLVHGLLGLVLDFFCFKRELPVQGERRVFEFLKPVGAVFGAQPLVPFLREWVIVADSGPYWWVVGGVSG